MRQGEKELIHDKLDLPTVYKKLKQEFLDAEINEEDGIKFDFKDKSWIHIRPSITEPIIKLFGEAKSEERLESLFNQARLTLQSK